MTNDENPCSGGITANCFKARPEHARQVMAYRVLGMLLGLRYIKRLQKFKGLPLPIKLDAEFGKPLDDSARSGLFSALAPTLVSVWEPGPVKQTQSIEGELALPTPRTAIIDVALATANIIVTGVSGKKIQLKSFCFTVEGETDLNWQYGAIPTSGPMSFGAANEPRGISHNFGESCLEHPEGRSLRLNSTLAVQVSGLVSYFLV